MANYGIAIRWIADNDNAGAEDSANEIADYLTTMLVADTWRKPVDQVSWDIWRTRMGIGRYARRV